MTSVTKSLSRILTSQNWHTVTRRMVSNLTVIHADAVTSCAKSFCSCSELKRTVKASSKTHNFRMQNYCWKLLLYSTYRFSAADGLHKPLSSWAALEGTQKALVQNAETHAHTHIHTHHCRATAVTSSGLWMSSPLGYLFFCESGVGVCSFK